MRGWGRGPDRLAPHPVPSSVLELLTPPPICGLSKNEDISIFLSRLPKKPFFTEDSFFFSHFLNAGVQASWKDVGCGKLELKVFSS